MTRSMRAGSSGFKDCLLHLFSLISTDSLLRSEVVMIRLWLTNSELSIAGRAWSFLPLRSWRLSSLRLLVAGALIRFACAWSLFSQTTMSTALTPRLQFNSVRS